jgi:hypothetical protein
MVMRAHQMFCAFALVALTGGAARGGAAPSEVIYPTQALPLTFSHKKHLAKGIGCDFCHDRASDSTRASDDLLPNEEVCRTCHAIDRAHPEKVEPKLAARGFANECVLCHPGFVPGRAVARVVVPAPFLKFDHKAHAEKLIDCARCHGDLSKVDLADRAQLPTMSSCLECHDSRRARLHASSRCGTCHLLKPDSTVETQFPSGTLLPSGSLKGDAHTIEFRTQHTDVARDSEPYCMSCHRLDFCQSCHNGVVKPFDFHSNDYVARHAVDARKNVPACGACHRSQSFCLGCHERVGVVDIRTGQDAAFRPLGPRSFHPPGWSDPSAANDPNHHAWQAQRNLRQCVSCHRQETCLQCHSTRGGGATATAVNPHPPGWRSSTRCQALASRNARMCLQCHAPGDPQLSCQ